MLPSRLATDSVSGNLGRIKPLTVGFGQHLASRNKFAVAVSLYKLQQPARPSRRTNTHNRTDVAVFLRS